MSKLRENSIGANGAKKMVIKPFKVQPKIPENFESQTWEKLKESVGAVYSKNSSALSKEELYRVILVMFFFFFFFGFLFCISCYFFKSLVGCGRFVHS